MLCDTNVEDGGIMISLEGLESYLCFFHDGECGSVPTQRLKDALELIHKSRTHRVAAEEGLQNEKEEKSSLGGCK